MYDRLGLESEYTDIMGIKLSTITIPVKPGRNLAIILEIAAMNSRQKKIRLSHEIFRQLAAFRIADQIRKGPRPKILKAIFTVHPLKAFFAALACGLYSRELCHTFPPLF